MQRRTKGRATKTVRSGVPRLRAFRLAPAAVLTSAFTLLLLAGCPPAKPPVEPYQIQPSQSQPENYEPNDPTPSATGPNSVEIPLTEPNMAEPNLARPNVPEPNVPEPNTSGPNVVEPNVAEPNLVEPNVVEPNIAEPNTPPVAVGPNEPNRTEPNAVKPRTKVTFHNQCAAILNKKLIDDKGMVKYKPLRWEVLNLGKLRGKFAGLKRSQYANWSRENKIAFWINAYNLNMLNIIAHNYPVESRRFDRLWWPPTSIRHIDKRIDGIKNQKFIIMDEEFTLSAIEKRFFLKEFDEPRVFFALSQASLDSPPLRNEPYTGEKLDKQLEDQTGKFLANPRAFRIDRGKKIVYLSSILQPSWYGSKFTEKFATSRKFKDHKSEVRAILNFISNYVSEKDKAFLETETYSIKYVKYDWRLNDGSRNK
ncbi:MAG: DUF547 domain-containing protein [Planctomycetota bacterium]